MYDVIDLVVSDSDTQDAIGAFRRTKKPELRRVFCRVGGIRRSEWAAAGAAGHKPELSVIVPAADYHGEHEAEYGGRRYSIYRTYPINHEWDVELYLEAKVGVSQ